MRPVLGLCGITIVFLILLQGARAQEPGAATYADIRNEIDLLNRQVEDLKSELLTSRPAQTGVENSAPILMRIDQLEEALRRLTGDTEQLRFRIDEVVTDATNRIGDLDFRLTELEGGDLGALGPAATLGTQSAPSAPAASDQALGASGAPAAIGELGEIRPRPRPGADLSGPFTDGADVPQASVDDAGVDPGVAGEPPAAPSETRVDFDAAMSAYRAGRYEDAARMFEIVRASAQGAQASSAASYWRGEALFALGDWSGSARSYLESFSAEPQGSTAPDALLRLGVSLGRLGQISEACLTLSEIENRFPSLPGDQTARIASEQRALNCS